MPLLVVATARKLVDRLLAMPFELTVSAGPKTHFKESPIPMPNDDQLVIKVVVSGAIPRTGNGRVE